MMNRISKKGIVVISLALITLLAVFAIAWNIDRAKKNATITFEYTPISAEVRINGKKVLNTAAVIPGDYTITIEKEGFTPYRQELSVTEHSTHTIRAVLDPESDDTQGWYEANQKDASIRERIFVRENQDASRRAQEKFPIMADLPYLGPKRIYRIHYGKGSKPNTQALYISYYNENAKEMALEWIKEKGYLIDDYEVFYRQLAPSEM